MYLLRITAVEKRRIKSPSRYIEFHATVLLSSAPFYDFIKQTKDGGQSSLFFLV